MGWLIQQRLESEYAAEVRKLKAEQPKGGRPPKLSKPTQKIAEVSKPDDRKTVGVGKREKTRNPLLTPGR